MSGIAARLTLAATLALVVSRGELMNGVLISD